MFCHVVVPVTVPRLWVSIAFLLGVPKDCAPFVWLATVEELWIQLPWFLHSCLGEVSNFEGKIRGCFKTALLLFSGTVVTIVSFQ